MKLILFVVLAIFFESYECGNKCSCKKVDSKIKEANTILENELTSKYDRKVNDLTSMCNRKIDDIRDSLEEYMLGHEARFSALDGRINDTEGIAADLESRVVALEEVDDDTETIYNPCDKPYTKPVGHFINVALGRPVTSSSINDAHRAPNSRLTDGERNPNYPYCAHTLRNHQPWMIVDLGRVIAVNHIFVLNRQDCCGDRTNHLTISVGETQSDMKVVFFNKNAIGKECYFILEKPVNARFVKVWLSITEALNICELEVYTRS